MSTKKLTTDGLKVLSGPKRVQPFKFGLIRSGILNWRPGKFFLFNLMIKSHERSIIPFTAA
jgi:hypothetical protein